MLLQSVLNLYLMISLKSFKDFLYFPLQIHGHIEDLHQSLISVWSVWGSVS